jgi:N-acetylglucosamine-6-phosphate deacetylase
MVVECGLPLAEVIAAASTTPARLVGATDRGAIAAGLRADLVALGPPPALDLQDIWIAA